MLENRIKNQSKTKMKLLVDVVIFIAFLILMDPHSSGLPIHEWLSIAMTAAIIVHLLLSRDWIAQVTRRFLGRAAGISRLNYILNWLLFLDGGLLFVFGPMISEVVLPAFGISLPMNFAWRSLHNLSTDLSLVLLGLHTALHWNWIVNSFKRYVLETLGRIIAGQS